MFSGRIAGPEVTPFEPRRLHFRCLESRRRFKRLRPAERPDSNGPRPISRTRPPLQFQQKLDRLDEGFLYSESIDLTSYSRQRDKLREELARQDSCGRLNKARNDSTASSGPFFPSIDTRSAVPLRLRASIRISQSGY